VRRGRGRRPPRSRPPGSRAARSRPAQRSSRTVTLPPSSRALRVARSSGPASSSAESSSSGAACADDGARPVRGAPLGPLHLADREPGAAGEAGALGQGGARAAGEQVAAPAGRGEVGDPLGPREAEDLAREVVGEVRAIRIGGGAAAARSRRRRSDAAGRSRAASGPLRAHGPLAVRAADGAGPRRARDGRRRPPRSPRRPLRVPPGARRPRAVPGPRAPRRADARPSCPGRSPGRPRRRAPARRAPRPPAVADADGGGVSRGRPGRSEVVSAAPTCAESSPPAPSRASCGAAHGDPHAATSSAASVRSAEAISGGEIAGIRASSVGEYARTASPGPWRAARPARWSALAREALTVTRPVMSRARSRRTSRDSPVSITRRTPGTVRELSASAVETTTRAGPASASARPRLARSCSRAGRRPCRGSTSRSGARERILRTSSSISRAPGTNTSASQCSRICCSTVVRARWSRKSLVTPRASSRGALPGSCSIRRGCRGAGTSTTRAPPSRSATCAASSVADIATTVRSSRSARTSVSMPSSRSLSRERSCTSSRITASTSPSSGSASRRRSSTPGVRTSSRVSGPTCRSPRTVRPTRSPSREPSSCAMRRAAARTATRRGWVTRVRPGTRSATSGGTNVVLPVPGGAVTTSAPVRAASASSSRAPATGRPAPIAARSKGRGAGHGRRRDRERRVVRIRRAQAG
jgi:hypothetical protein